MLSLCVVVKVVKGIDLNVCMVSKLYMYWVLIVYLVSLRVFELSSHDEFEMRKI